MVTSFGMSDGARARHDRREGRRGVPRRLAAGPRLGRPVDARPDRPRGRAARRRGRGARARSSSTATGAPSRRPPTRCSSTRRSPASRSTPCSRPCSEIDAGGAARRAPPRARARPGAQTLRRFAAGALIAAAIASAGAASARGEASWRLEQPPPPAGAPFKVPLGRARRPAVLGAQRGPARASRATRRSPAACSSTTGAAGTSSRPSAAAPATRRGSPGPGPDEFWTITEPSQPRVGVGLGLCHFKDGVVVGSYSTPLQSPDPFRPMDAAACNGPERLLVRRRRRARTRPGSASAPSTCTGTART